MEPRTPDMACDIYGQWGYAAWCGPPTSHSHTWIDDEPFPGSRPCPICGSKRTRTHINITMGDRNTRRRRRLEIDGLHGWQRSAEYGWVSRSWSLNRKVDIYEEIVATMDGTVIREIREPLSVHTGRGTARLGPPATLDVGCLRQLRPEERMLGFRVLPVDKKGWDAVYWEPPLKAQAG
jgi:hypothetical protein